MTLVLAVAVIGVACGGGPDREAIATEVAEEWVEDRVDTVAEVVVELLNVSPALRDTLSSMPQSKKLLAGIVANQVRDKVAWGYSVPIRDSQGLYRVTATAAAEIEIDLPMAGTWAFAVTLPIHLLVDTDARAVEEWGIDLENAAVASN